MGSITWLAAGLLALLSARPVRRMKQDWKWELAAAVTLSFLGGIAATALDFGGWSEPDWRAALFAFLTGFTGIAILRLLRGQRNPGMSS